MAVQSNPNALQTWLKDRTPERPPAPPASNGMWFNEWSECRTTIGRFDTILSEMRKYGFTLVTGLLTANAIFGGAPKGGDRAVASISIMVLILVLFFVDTFYGTLLNGAVERAMDLETCTAGDQLNLTSYISANSRRSSNPIGTLFIYEGLLFATWFVGFTLSGPTDFLVWWFAVLAVLMLLYWFFSHLLTGGFTVKTRIKPTPPTPGTPEG